VVVGRIGGICWVFGRNVCMMGLFLVVLMMMMMMMIACMYVRRVVVR
jgi:hypothetical protein